MNSYHWINRRVTPTSHQSISPIRTGHVCKRFACIVVVICNVSSCASSGRRGWRGWGWGWSGWAWTGRSSNTAFRKLEASYRGAFEHPTRILAAATPVLALIAGGAKLPISLEGSGTGGWRRWTGWAWTGRAWTGRSSNTAFRRLETTYRGALETAVASRILAAAALVLALRTAGTERPIAQKVLELATRVRGACSIGSGSASIRGVYTTKSRDHHVRSISINVGYRGE